MLPRPASTTLLAGAVAATVAGCGITNPYGAGRQPSTSTQTATATAPPAATTTGVDHDPIPEQGGTIPASAARQQTTLASDAAQPTPQDAVARYARLDINWTARTVPAIQRELATISLGSARAQALQAAASTANDTTLRASRVANAGTVVAIATGTGAASGDWVVVTRETTTGTGNYQGLPPQLHITYAHVTHQPNGWVVSSWSPQD